MSHPEARPLRSDARTNRDRLLAVATRAFVSATGEPSMRAIAREAGVGIATLYRHFPTREALVEAIYHDQLERLTSGARELLARAPAPLALRSWMDLFGEWVAAKSGMLDTLRAMIETGRIAHARTRTELLEAIETILAAGRGTGELRSDVSAEDVAAGLIGIFSVARQDDASRGARLLDVFADGLRAPAVSPSADERLR